MTGSTDKCQLIISTDEQIQILIGDSSIKKNSCERLLAVNIDSKLNLDDHVKTICSKASNKLGSLPRSTPYMSI